MTEDETYAGQANVFYGVAIWDNGRARAWSPSYRAVKYKIDEAKRDHPEAVTSILGLRRKP